MMTATAKEWKKVGPKEYERTTVSGLVFRIARTPREECEAHCLEYPHLTRSDVAWTLNVGNSFWAGKSVGSLSAKADEEAKFRGGWR